MKKQILTTIITMLLLCSAQVLCAQTTDYVITVNGSVLEQKAAEMWVYRPYGVNYYVPQTKLRIAWEEEDGNWSTLDLNPLQAKLFFGDAATDDIGKPKIFDGGNLQDKLRLGGLPEGTPVMVYNTAGHQCLSTRISSKETPIDTSKLPSGIYIVKAGKTVIKFIKK